MQHALQCISSLVHCPVLSRVSLQLHLLFSKQSLVRSATVFLSYYPQMVHRINNLPEVFFYTSSSRYSTRPATSLTSSTRDNLYYFYLYTTVYIQTTNLPPNIKILQHAFTSIWLHHYPARQAHLPYPQHRQRSRKTPIQQKIHQQREH